MRGTKVKALRTADRPHPGRLGGGNVKSVGVRGQRPKWRSSKDRKKEYESIMAEFRNMMAKKKAEAAAKKKRSEAAKKAAATRKANKAKADGNEV